MHARILAIDYGRVRHGLAVSDALGLTGHPLPALQRSSPERDLATLRRIVAEHEVQRLVIGLPLDMDGGEGRMAGEVRRFGDALAGELGLPLVYEDERLTTDAAEALLQQQGLRPSDRRRLRDSLAAALILRGVLEQEGSSPG